MHLFSFAYALQLQLPLQHELEPDGWWECHLWSPGSTEEFQEELQIHAQSETYDIIGITET